MASATAGAPPGSLQQAHTPARRAHLLPQAVPAPALAAAAARRRGCRRRPGHASFEVAVAGASPAAGPAAGPAAAAAAGLQPQPEPEPVVDRTLFVKISLAASSGKLDLSDYGLSAMPPAVFDISGLEELSLAGNQLAELPPEISRLDCLQRLQLSGNLLTSLPASLGKLTALQGLWLHGNLLEGLPHELGQLSGLTQLSLAGNRLLELPDCFTGMPALSDLGLAGNRLASVPPSLGALAGLRKLALHGNELESLPGELFSGLSQLQELWLQGNRLGELPPSITRLPALQELSAADNRLVRLPPDGWAAGLPCLESLWLYGNRLASLPSDLAACPSLTNVWLEGNAPLQGEALDTFVASLRERHGTDEAAAAAAAAGNGSGGDSASNGGGTWRARLRSVGLDRSQLVQQQQQQQQAVGDPGSSSQVAAATTAAAAALPPSVQVGVLVAGATPGLPGYFKLQLGHAPGTRKLTTASGAEACRVLVVAMGSAPGVPNWGGLLSRVYKAAEEPAHGLFDVLYVVDPRRAWYGGGGDDGEAGDEGAEQKDVEDSGSAGGASSGWDALYGGRLAAAAAAYDRVVVLGDSMGATAALLAAPHATAVHAFCPQVDLASSSIRPGRPAAWQARLTARCTAAAAQAAAAGCSVCVHVGNWRHDLDQARGLPQDAVTLKIYDVDSHRLALYLDSRGKLLPLVRGAILNEMGLRSGNVKLTNLL